MKQKPAAHLIEKICFDNTEHILHLCGEHDKHLKLLEKIEPVKLSARGNILSISGESLAVGLIKNLLTQLYRIVAQGYPLYATDIDYAHRILSENGAIDLERIFLDTVFISSKKKGDYPQEHCPETLY